MQAFWAYFYFLLAFPYLFLFCRSEQNAIVECEMIYPSQFLFALILAESSCFWSLWAYLGLCGSSLRYQSHAGKAISCIF
jgi:hypothetical protein